MPQSAVRIGARIPLAFDEGFLRPQCYTTAEQHVAYSILGTSGTHFDRHYYSI